MNIAEVVFWGSLGVTAYVYLAYPVIVWLLSRCCRDVSRPRGLAETAGNGEWPFVSLVIAAYREETVILERLNNALLVDYPADRFEIIVGCDGNEDLTGELVRSVQDSRVRLFEFPERRGKASVLNARGLCFLADPTPAQH